MTNNKSFTIVILFTISIMFLIRCATKSSKEDRASIPLIKFELVGVEETNYPEYEVYSANAKKALVKDAPGTINLFAIESDLERDGLNGKIKSIRSMEFHAIRKNGKIIKGDTTVREWNNHFKTFNESKQVDEINLKRNYLNSDIVPFLICNYSNTVYDRFLRFLRPHIPVFIVHFLILIIGKSYHYRFPLDNYKRIFS